MPEQPALKRVRIAVVDSGVEPSHHHIDAERLQPGVSIAADGTVQQAEDATADRLGHGTAVTAAIQQWAPQADIAPVRVFLNGLTTSPRALLKAVQYCVDGQFDLVNLSLGTRVPEHRVLFAQAADIAREEGVVLVSARCVGEDLCYPGCLDDALGVGLDWELPRNAFRFEAVERNALLPKAEAAVQGAGCYVLASGYPRPIPGVPQQRNLFGVSFSVANMTGLAARILQQSPAFQTGDWEQIKAQSDCLTALRYLLRAHCPFASRIE